MSADLVIIGAGPQGLATAAHALERGLEPLVLESGDRPAAAIAEWAHVRLFSDWSELIDASAARLLAPTGWQRPGPGIPTGGEWIERYLAPLAAALGDRVLLNRRVVSVARAGDGFVVTTADGSTFSANAVIDASGTWRQPRPAGADGRLADGEEAARATGRVTSRIPGPAELAALAGAHVVVIGAGHSAATAIGDLAAIARDHPSTRVTWVMRRSDPTVVWGGGSSDALPARAALGERARSAVDGERVRLVTGFRTGAIDDGPDGAVVRAVDGTALDPAERVIVLTGFGPDLSFLEGLDLDLDPVLLAPVRLAPEIDPTIHSCGTVAASGIAELAQPEDRFVILGAKSYGTAPTFLALTGYEQARSVVAHLAGDSEAAARNDLVLPETGVCGGTGESDAACCAPGPQLLTLGRAPGVGVTR